MIAVGCDEGLFVLKIDDNIFEKTPQSDTKLDVLKTDFELEAPLAASPVITFICSVCQREAEYHKTPAIYGHPAVCPVCNKAKIHFKDRVRSLRAPLFISIAFLVWSGILLWLFSSYHQRWRWFFLILSLPIAIIGFAVSSVSIIAIYRLVKTHLRIKMAQRQEIVWRVWDIYSMYSILCNIFGKIVFKSVNWIG